MREPPRVLDGAVVLYWATSGARPFFEMPAGDSSVPIHGLAVCRYPTGAIYRFSCDQSWEVQNDSDYQSVEEAMTAPSAQYDVASVAWVRGAG